MFYLPHTGFNPNQMRTKLAKNKTPKEVYGQKTGSKSRGVKSPANPKDTLAMGSRPNMPGKNILKALKPRVPGKK